MVNKIPQPIYDRLLVKVDDKEQVSEGGIVLPQSEESEDDVLRGIVVAVGPGRLNDAGETIPMVIEKDNEIAFDPNHAAIIKVSGIEYFLLDEPYVLAIL